MDQRHLAALIERPEVQRQLLKGYRGPFSLGITLNPWNRRELAISVQIADSDPSRLPSEVELEGEMISVVVEGDFKTPRPLF
jgi:hypothetical protein